MTREEIKDIAQNLDCGFRCFVHRHKKDVKFMPDPDNYPDIDTSAWDKDIKAINRNRQDYIEIAGMDSGASFRLMQEFVGMVDDEGLQEKLAHALRRPKPFWNFKYELSQFEIYRDKWFKFKEERLIEMVEEQVELNGL
jgi:hypothetical protein